jgi:DNA adenine methylase
MLLELKAKAINRYEYDPSVQPFLKWAGGKRQLLNVIGEYIPQHYTHYYEPFVGAGAVLFFLQPEQATINDINGELINCYRVIRDNPEALLALCQEHKENNSKEYFYKLRGLDRTDKFEELAPEERAARIIYLNKTCFNGLFRVNRKGQFNVPYGDYVSPAILNQTVLSATSRYLNQNEVTILENDFAEAVAKAGKGSFVYFDPPYQPLSDTSYFTGYAMNGFREDEQRRLKVLCDDLDSRGCQVLVSNSNAPLIRELYDDSRYEIIEVQATRAINSVAINRESISELLIHNRYERRGIER